MWYKKTVFFSSIKDSVDHIFFKCSVARYIWNTGFDTVPVSMEELCDQVMNFRSKDRNLVSVGVVTVIWSIWGEKGNDACFRNIFPMDPSCVVGKVAY